MDDLEIVEKIKLGTVFYNPNIKTNLVFQVIEWSGNVKDVAKVNCVDKVTGHIHMEKWDDMNITVTALSMGEYRFIESAEGLSHD
jgi:hypothetical protein